jgi:hypothetical protein
MFDPEAASARRALVQGAFLRLLGELLASLGA